MPDESNALLERPAANYSVDMNKKDIKKPSWQSAASIEGHIY